MAFNEVQRIIPANDINAARLVAIAHTIALLCDEHHLRPERRANELARFAELLQHRCDRCAVLCIKVGIDFVEEIEGRGVALLNGKDEGESTQACCGLLVSDAMSA